MGPLPRVRNTKWLSIEDNKKASNEVIHSVLFVPIKID
jgi:hypothetical protein